MSEHGTFSIRIVDDEGNGVGGVTVRCTYGYFSGQGKEYTDSDGWCEFDIIHEAVLGGGAIKITEISVNSVVVLDESFYPEDGDTFSFTLPEDD